MGTPGARYRGDGEEDGLAVYEVKDEEPDKQAGHEIRKEEAQAEVKADVE